MYHDILVPTDGSAEIATVTEHATELADDRDGTIHGLYVLDTASLSALPGNGTLASIEGGLREEGQEALDALESHVDGLTVETTIRTGSPAVEICEYAREHGCDLVVMGTHGRSGVSRLLLGSVAERVVRSSPVPVLTVKVVDATQTP